MEITVYNSNSEMVFQGDAEDFLFNNSCDDELEIALDKLSRYGMEEVKFYCSETDEEYTIIKEDYND